MASSSTVPTLAQSWRDLEVTMNRAEKSLSGFINQRLDFGLSRPGSCCKSLVPYPQCSACRDFRLPMLLARSTVDTALEILHEARTHQVQSAFELSCRPPMALPLHNRRLSYSHLSATIGSTRIARRDGSHAAISAMARNKSEIPANETLSTVLTPCSTPRSK
jgi:hypothetical protein